MYERVHAYVHATVGALSFNYYEMIITKYCLFCSRGDSSPRVRFSLDISLLSAYVFTWSLLPFASLRTSSLSPVLSRSISFRDSKS